MIRFRLDGSPVEIDQFLKNLQDHFDVDRPSPFFSSRGWKEVNCYFDCDFGNQPAKNHAATKPKPEEGPVLAKIRIEATPQEINHTLSKLEKMFLVKNTSQLYKNRIDSNCLLYCDIAEKKSGTQ